jgi:hypothetical protein
MKSKHPNQGKPISTDQPLSKVVDIRFYELTPDQFGCVLFFDKEIEAQNAFDYLRSWKNIKMFISETPEKTLSFGLYSNFPGAGMHTFNTNFKKEYITELMEFLPHDSAFHVAVAIRDTDNAPIFVLSKDGHQLLAAGYKYMTLAEVRSIQGQFPLKN